MKNGGRIGERRAKTGCPVRDLILSIYDRMERDLKLCRQAGVLDGNTVIDKWPTWKGRPLNVGQGYRSCGDVQRLVDDAVDAAERIKRKRGF